MSVEIGTARNILEAVRDWANGKLDGKVDKESGKGLSSNDYTSAEKTKLAGVESGANKYVHPSHTARASGFYKITVDSLGHVTAVTSVTGTDIPSHSQDASTINVSSQGEDLESVIDAILSGLDSKIATSQKGVANGVATLGSDAKVPQAQLPSYVDDVVEYASRSAFPTTGESGKIYIALDTNKTYRWSGSTYVEIAAGLALGETSSTAYRGDRGKAAYDHSQITSGNPHNTVPSQISGFDAAVETKVKTTGVEGIRLKDVSSGTGSMVITAEVYSVVTPGDNTILHFSGAHLEDCDIAWDLVVGKPTSFPPSAHTHTVSQISDLTFMTKTDMTRVLNGQY